MPGTVYLHIGSGKTGTSAIQVALVRNREALAKCGLVYPEAESDFRAQRGMVTGGNGSALRGVLWPPTARTRRRDEGLKKILWASDQRAAELAKGALRDLIVENEGCSFIYSSEGFSGLSQEALAELHRIFCENGLRVRAIYYVRHVMDMAWSWYNQMLKGRVALITFQQFLQTYKCNYKHVIGTFSNVIGNDNMIIRSYDQEKHNLIAGFFNLIMEQEGIDGGNLFISDDKEKIVNRSLTRGEIEVMLFVNRLLHKSHGEGARAIAKKISERMLRSPANPEAAKVVVSAEEMRIIEENNKDVLDFVNDFTRGEFELRLKSDNIEIGERTRSEDGEHGAAYRNVIASLIKHLRGPARQNSAPRKARRLRKGTSDKSAASPGPPIASAAATPV